MALIFAQWKLLEETFFPFAVILQVTPVVSIAPLLLVYLNSGAAVLVCAFLVAFFPILANTALGLNSVDHNLVDLFQLYRSPGWRQLLLLRIPAALPYFLAGLRIGGGLALIGAIVAEIAAGSAGKGAGLAFRIVESGYRLNIPRMFAALFLISVSGVIIFLLLSGAFASAAAPLARQRPGPRGMIFRAALQGAKRYALLARARPGSAFAAGPGRARRRGFHRGRSRDRRRPLRRDCAGRPRPDLAGPCLTLGGRIALPPFVDVHTHLDKAHIWRAGAKSDRRLRGRPRGRRQGPRRQLERCATSPRRMEFCLRSAYAHGTRAIRTHIDSVRPADGDQLAGARRGARTLARPHRSASLAAVRGRVRARPVVSSPKSRRRSTPSGRRSSGR